MNARNMAECSAISLCPHFEDFSLVHQIKFLCQCLWRAKTTWSFICILMDERNVHKLNI